MFISPEEDGTVARVLFDPDTLSNQRKMNTLLSHRTDYSFPSLPDAQYNEWKNSILRQGKKNRLELGFEETASGKFKELLRSFVELKSMTDTSALDLGKVYVDMKQGTAYFRLQDLMLWLERKRFEGWKSGKVKNVLAEKYGSGNSKLSTKRGRVNCVSIPISALSSEDSDAEAAILKPASLTESDGELL